MSNERLIAEFSKNISETVKVVLQVWKQSRYCDIRIWTALRPGDVAGEQPTRKGITLAVELLPDLRSAIDDTIKAAALEEETGARE